MYINININICMYIFIYIHVYVYVYKDEKTVSGFTSLATGHITTR